MARIDLLQLRTRGRAGAISIEALISIIFLMGSLMFLWGFASALYNQSKMQTASQFASQGALLVFDRSTYRGENVSGPFGNSGRSYDYARERAERVARNLFAENACGMMLNAATSDTPISCHPDGPADDDSSYLTVDVQCAPELDGPWREPTGASDPDCSAGMDHARALRASVRSHSSQSILYMAPLSDDSDLLDVSLNGSADTFSYYPVSKDD